METTSLGGKVHGYLSPHRTLLSTGSLSKPSGVRWVGFQFLYGIPYLH